MLDSSRVLVTLSGQRNRLKVIGKSFDKKWMKVGWQAACLIVFVLFTSSATAVKEEASIIEAVREIRRLPGSLDQIPVFNSNSPEVVLKNGILLSTFPSSAKHAGENEPSQATTSEKVASEKVPAIDANLDYPLQGRFDIFAHHIVDGKKSGHMEPLYLAILVGNLGDEPVKLQTIESASYLSRPDAPFIKLPSLSANDRANVFAGPGDRVCTELLKGEQMTEGWPRQLHVPPNTTRLLASFPMPVRSLDLPLNGRTIMARLQTNRPVRLALVARFAEPLGEGIYKAPSEAQFVDILNSGRLVEPREEPATAPDQKGALRYGRVSGITLGSTWECDLVDPGLDYMKLPIDRPVSYPIATVRQGAFGTGQIQSAPLVVRYKDTAYEGHGNYGVLYKMNLALLNDTSEKHLVSLSLETPLKSDKAEGKVKFLEPIQSQVFFRGTIKTSGQAGVNASSFFTLLTLGLLRHGPQMTHIVEHRGESTPPFWSGNISPGTKKRLSIEFFYPPDCTPPQLLTITGK